MVAWLQSVPLGRAILFGIPILAVLTGIATWNPRGEFWHGVEFPKAQCEAYDAGALAATRQLSESVYDAAKLARLFREPQNTVSNLAFVIAGFAVLLASRQPASRSLGLACVLLGVGSGFYHASLLPEWRLIDILGVYSVLYALVLVGVSALCLPLRRPVPGWAGVLGFWIAAIYTGVYRNDIRVWGFKLFDSTYVVVASVAVLCVLVFLAFLRARDRRTALRATALLVISAPTAFAGGLGDRFGGFLANPDAVVQGHTVWHALGAVAIVAAYEVFAASGFDRSTLGGRANTPESR